ncbi:MAG: hydrogenase maturation protease [Clostridiales bacterium]|nr:hydrogenase maturation protease [Clostridiales bacterium]
MIKLLAIGNWLMTDDAVALEVAGRLSKRLKKMNIDVVFGETDCMSCLLLPEVDDFVIILDAMSTGAEPGSILMLNLEEAATQPFMTFSQHEMSVFELIKVYNINFKGSLIGIEAAQICPGERLSSGLMSKLPEICAKTETAIIRIIEENGMYSDAVM